MGSIQDQSYQGDLWFSLGPIQEPGKQSFNKIVEERFDLVYERLPAMSFKWHKKETTEYK